LSFFNCERRGDLAATPPPAERKKAESGFSPRTQKRNTENLTGRKAEKSQFLNSTPPFEGGKGTCNTQRLRGNNNNGESKREGGGKKIASKFHLNFCKKKKKGGRKVHELPRNESHSPSRRRKRAHRSQRGGEIAEKRKHFVSGGGGRGSVSHIQRQGLNTRKRTRKKRYIGERKGNTVLVLEEKKRLLLGRERSG